MKVDPAVLKLLQLDGDATFVSSAGGGGCSSASTSRIVSKLNNGSENTFFMKTGSGNAAKVMFEGEHASLNAINTIVPSLCPRSYGYGNFESDPNTSFLITDFLHLTSRSSSRSNAPSLAQKLAKLHTTSAPTPDGYDRPMFGFPYTTCCGDTPQDNSYKESWADFYAENRLRSILRGGEKAQGPDNEFHNLVEATASQVVPQLIGDDHLNNGKRVTPVVVHGDLWSGNASTGVIGSKEGELEDLVFDSSACYAHSEFELGIMKMFGGFGRSFLEEYHELCPKTEPVEEYEDRVKLYELYHHLNHWAMFGGGYKSGAASIMRSLVKRYGEKG
ncbi:Ketosamine-3-kinase [Didymella exigua CBS 183.55]|uniref:protein-ribulosamine 3-kinase n=1 Tax=Didymella exigua CBS 183.55 TaxID=1150837 RepID=A0A6A5S487_9PLEO|nr:Ketosamine-3-kinase [Didymella exigua CBS 183.55]KAF1934410.1 Ketosamine-3-kinase [Didymella exigua CBS 183.55]